MDELPPHVKAYLRSARLTHQPPAGAQERVRERIRFLEHGAVNPDPTVGRVHRGLPVRQLRLLVVASGAAAIMGALVWMQSQRTEPARLPETQHRQIEATPAVPESMQPHVREREVVDAGTDSRPRRPQRNRGPEVRVTDPKRLLVESRILSAASRALLDADLSGARKQLDNYRRRFPDGQLLSERDGLEVLYGCVSGAEGSVARARAYTEQAQGGLLVSRIQSACRLTGSP